MAASRGLTNRRAATHERWQKAAERAVKKNVSVRQLQGSGAWIATSATDPTKAYELEIRDGIVLSCACEASAVWGDPVCCHKAAYYLSIGTIVLPGAEENPEGFHDDL